ncbi:hypothetical protein CDL12_18127 [Handroanthus impetiginosus]|uniref:Uncharacterized protein n=1 Tax=Handroanthus impetiginosus TaxID=429701 RepID=A0A2G9GVI6_9LAMI|nr:hypothetical protein CDL12_18127 [Handroanthus impetiginosus]
MSFPPNLGITNSFIIDSNSPLLFQELSSLIPPLHQISSPFSRTKMNGYSRITKPTSTRSKSVDFSDLSFPRSTPNSKPDLKITTVHNTIQENEQDDGSGEVFGVILSRKCPIFSVPSDDKMVSEQENSPSLQKFVKKSLSIKRSVSVSEGYSRIHHQSYFNGEDHDDLYGTEVSSQKKSVKKKGKFFKACKRLFGL